MGTAAQTVLKLVCRWSHHLIMGVVVHIVLGGMGDECFHPTPADNSACRSGVIEMLQQQIVQ